MEYITEYSVLDPKERIQLSYKRRFKLEHPDWDDSMVLLTRLVLDRLPVGACVFDAGCGNGNFVIDELRGQIGRAVGMDADPSCTAKNVCLDEIVYGTLDRLPFGDSSFDAVVSLWVIEHLDEPTRAFSEMFRVLKPGGMFAFVTPNVDSAIVAVRRLLSARTAKRIVSRLYGRKENDTFDVHYRANTVKRLKELADEVGFSVSVLRENADPSYTSFGPVSYTASSLFARIRSAVSKPHIVGILEKPLG